MNRLPQPDTLPVCESREIIRSLDLIVTATLPQLFLAESAEDSGKVSKKAKSSTDAGPAQLRAAHEAASSIVYATLNDLLTLQNELYAQNGDSVPQPAWSSPKVGVFSEVSSVGRAVDCSGVRSIGPWFDSGTSDFYFTHLILTPNVWFCKICWYYFV